MKNNFIKRLLFNILFFSFIISLNSCVNGLNYEKGNGKVIKETRTFESFNSLDISGGFQIHLKQDSLSSVEIEADENLMKYISTQIKNRTLIIENKVNIKGSKSIQINIHTPNYEEIDLSGAIDLFNLDTLKLETLKIDISGASKITLNLKLKELFLDCSGSGEINLAGKADKVHTDLSGASEINAFNFIADKFEFSSSGSSKANLNVVSHLIIESSGSTKLNYKGNPNVDQNTSGSSKVIKVD